MKPKLFHDFIPPNKCWVTISEKQNIIYALHWKKLMYSKATLGRNLVKVNFIVIKPRGSS